MPSALRGSARTTPRLSIRTPSVEREQPALATRYGLNPKTVVKWRKRTRRLTPDRTQR